MNLYVTYTIQSYNVGLNPSECIEAFPTIFIEYSEDGYGIIIEPDYPLSNFYSWEIKIEEIAKLQKKTIVTEGMSPEEIADMILKNANNVVNDTIEKIKPIVKNDGIKVSGFYGVNLDFSDQNHYTESKDQIIEYFQDGIKAMQGWSMHSII